MNAEGDQQCVVSRGPKIPEWLELQGKQLGAYVIELERSRPERKNYCDDAEVISLVKR